MSGAGERAAGARGVDSEREFAPCTRRALLEGLAVAGCLVPLHAFAQAVDPAAKSRPQIGDRLAFATGARAGQPLEASAVVLAAEPLSAWPMDATTGLLRDGSRLNQLRVLRLDPAALSPRTAPNAAEGVVAYATMCSHAGCDVTGWSAATRGLVCPCHGSEFSAEDAATVIRGPATQPLAMLPLRIENGELRVARGFTRKVGFTPA